MSVDTVLVDGFPHGTPEGYTRGCRGGGTCANKGSDTLMTCRQASVRYRGDLAYRQAVQAGAATAELEAFDDAAPQKLPRPQRSTGGALVHGTPNGYNHYGCRLGDQCPSKLGGGPSCCEACMDAQKARRQSRKLRATAASL